jgi:hypothetical protein
MRPRIIKDIDRYGKCHISIQDKSGILGEITEDGKGVEEKEITHNVALFISNAFKAGYETGLNDAHQAMSLSIKKISSIAETPIAKIVLGHDWRGTSLYDKNGKLIEIPEQE